jgi:glycoside/pentoside/hexuronide:cation symporter, GPH family
VLWHGHFIWASEQRTNECIFSVNAAPRLEIARYSFFAAPLAMAALPIYVHIPKYYAELGLSLASLGYLLLVLRLADAFVDPLLGRWADNMRTRFTACAIATVALAVGMMALLNPAYAGTSLWLWLTVSLIVVYFGFSLATIAHSAWGAELPPRADARATYTASREAVGLIGVLFAAALPSVLATNTGQGLAKFSWIFLVVLIVALFALWRLREAKVEVVRGAPLLGVLSDKRFRALLAIFALNGIASAIPATLLLFFVDDVLGAKDMEPTFLVSYFLAGAIAMPLWAWLARRYGKVIAWAIGMMLAVLAFVWAASFGNGDRMPFLVVCIATGIALGADLSLPPALLADAIAKARAQSQTGSYFGLWAFVTKANLALAAGLALPLVSWLGYAVGNPSSNVTALTYTYTVLPCALKLCALALLWHYRNLLKEDL